MEFFGVRVYFGERGVKFSSDFVYIHDFHIIYNFGCVQFLFLYPPLGVDCIYAELFLNRIDITAYDRVALKNNFQLCRFKNCNQYQGFNAILKEI